MVLHVYVIRFKFSFNCLGTAACPYIYVDNIKGSKKLYLIRPVQCTLRRIVRFIDGPQELFQLLRTPASMPGVSDPGNSIIMSLGLLPTMAAKVNSLRS